MYDNLDEALIPDSAERMIGSSAPVGSHISAVLAGAAVPPRRSLEQLFLDSVGAEDSGQ